MDINLEGQNIINVEIEKEMRRSYIDYSMSVIVGRALPDVRDGLKPVHRRILFSMYEDGLTSDKPFRKSATTVGNVLGHYHPHGDTAVYDAMVRLAQPFSMRYPLVEGHGNFGNVDGDGAAAYRYTEARMSKMANEMMVDIEKRVVDFIPNFDNKAEEPVVLPARFPNLLVNGSVGIAVGMATNIPPHNMSEVIDGTIYLMDNPKCTVPDLIQIIKGPDFPTYATIHGTKGIHEAYMTGRGKVLVRAKAHFEEKNGRTSIVFTEIPYQVNKSMLVSSIADLIKNKRIEGIADLRDESGRAGMRIVVDLKREANSQLVLNLLYKYSQLQDTFAINMLALVDGEPKTLNLKQVLHHYIRHQEEVVTRRVQFDLDKAKARLHILEGYKLAIDNIDAVIATIRASTTIPDARNALIANFGFSEIQAQAIVEMPLGRLAGLEIEKILNEMAEKIALVERLEAILADENEILAIIREELLEVKRKFGDERRTEIELVENEILLEDLIERQKCAITISNSGYIKRMPIDVYQSQNRGGKGITAMATKEEDYVKDIFISHSHNYLFLFSNYGKLFIKKCYEIPEASRTSKGTNIVNILNLREGEKITAFISVGKINTDEYLVMVTKQGIVKRTELSKFRHIRKDGVIAITLLEEDELLYVNKTDGNHDVVIATSNGNGIRFAESDVRVMGRTAKGVRGVRLGEGCKVVGVAVLDPNSETEGKTLLTITERGFGKKTASDLYPIRHRGGKGIICHKLTEKTGALAGMCEVHESDDVMLITDGGMLIRTPVAQVSETGRSASGVIIMRMAQGSNLAGFQRIVNEDDTDKIEVTEETEESDDVLTEDETAVEEEEAEDEIEEDIAEDEEDDESEE